MDWTVTTGDAAQAAVDALIVPIGAERTLTPLAQRLDAALGDSVTALLTDYDFSGSENAVQIVHTWRQLPARFLVLLGTGAAGGYSVEKLRNGVAAAARAARDANAKSLALALNGDLDAGAAGQAVAEGVLLGTYSYLRYKSEPSSKALTHVHVFVDEAAVATVRAGIDRGQHIANGVILARDLVNEPGNDLWPDRLASIAREMADSTGLQCDVYDEKALAEMGAGALVAVGRGSDRPPRLVHLRYRPEGGAVAPITFVGKGITFDTGGYSIKPANSMETMKDDMAGAAAVLGAMQAIAHLRPAVAVDAVVASAENMISGAAIRPGDVLRSLSGKTIEVNNTDAEGRLVLADALTFANRAGATELIDLATLTGACLVALGYAAVGVMGNNQALLDRLIKAAEAEGERMWQLPLFDDYRETLRSDIADMRNSGGRYGGAQIGAAFLREFAGATPWAHLDIAGPAWLMKDTPLAPKGATGVGVRALVRYAIDAGERVSR